jgi:hypothetical protein
MQWSAALTVMLACAVAVPVAASASPSARTSATAKKGGSYTGSTTQGLPASFKISKSGRRLNGTIEERVPCEGTGLALQQTEKFTSSISRRGRISGEYEYEDDVPDEPSIGSGDLRGAYSHHVVGRFTRARRGIWRRLSGTWHGHVMIKDGSGAVVGHCDTGHIPFVAKR